MLVVRIRIQDLYHESNDSGQPDVECDVKYEAESHRQGESSISIAHSHPISRV